MDRGAWQKDEPKVELHKEIMLVLKAFKERGEEGRREAHPSPSKEQRRPRPLEMLHTMIVPLLRKWVAIEKKKKGGRGGDDSTVLTTATDFNNGTTAGDE